MKLEALIKKLQEIQASLPAGIDATVAVDSGEEYRDFQIELSSAQPEMALIAITVE